MYHMKQGYSDIKDLPVYERKWLIDRFIEQKKKEEEASKGGGSPPRGMPRIAK